jgi:serine phosphatase RsbU (regulator of sigma subunit)
VPGTATRGAPWVDVGVAVRALPGQRASGDCEVVRTFTDGALLAAVDGLGHGLDAAEAAQRGCKTLELYAGEAPVALVRRCHAELRGTRGAAMSIASFDARQRTLTWISVGNVEGVLWRKESDRMHRSGLVTRGGVVGSTLPALQDEVLPVSAGDLLILATDGIRREFAEEPAQHLPPQALANQILARFARETDDALVVVARFVAAPPPPPPLPPPPLPLGASGSP